MLDNHFHFTERIGALATLSVDEDEVPIVGYVVDTCREHARDVAIGMLPLAAIECLMVSLAESSALALIQT